MSIVAVTGGCLVISILCNILFWDRSFGVSVPIFSAVVIGFLLWLKKGELSKSKVTLFLHLLLIGYLSVCAAVYRNDIILCAAMPTVFLGLGGLVFCGKEKYGFSNSLGLTESIIKNSFCGIFYSGRALRETLDRFGSEGASKAAKKVFIGILISIPFLIIFGALFVSADAVFEKNVADFLKFIWRPEFIARAAAIFLVWFLFCGYVARVRSKDISLESCADKAKAGGQFDGLIVFVFLLMNNLLFLAFIVVQLGYLFGGESLIRSSSLTYAQYVHRGFYEFWFAVVLISMIILITDFKMQEVKGGVKRLVQFCWIAMICQTLVIIASGVKRIMVYQEAYGYTYLRILVGLFLLWMAGVFLLFIAKIIRGKSTGWLISAGLCLAFMFLIFVSTFSLDSFIARRNVERYLTENKQIDMKYLKCLSTDAYPYIVRLKEQSADQAIKDQADDIIWQMRKTARESLQYRVSWNLSLKKAVE